MLLTLEEFQKSTNIFKILKHVVKDHMTIYLLVIIDEL